MEPYYLYRQKNMAGNFENVGYSLPGKACLYNILIMEEMTDDRRLRCRNDHQSCISRLKTGLGALRECKGSRAVYRAGSMR